MPVKIMIADDHTMFRTGLATVLRGFEEMEVVAQAKDGPEALRLDQELKPDVILLDINMPMLDGFEVLDELKKRGSAAKAIMISMHEEDEYIVKALSAGANGYLCKTAEASEIRKAVNTVVKDNVYFNELTNNAMLKQVIDKNTKTGVKAIDDNFSEKELMILQLLADGLSNNDIAQKIFASARTVENTRYNMMKKIGVNNGMGLLVYAIKNQLIKV